MIKIFGLSSNQDTLMTLDGYIQILKNNLKNENEFLQIVNSIF